MSAEERLRRLQDPTRWNIHEPQPRQFPTAAAATTSRRSWMVGLATVATVVVAAAVVIGAVSLRDSAQTGPIAVPTDTASATPSPTPTELTPPPTPDPSLTPTPTHSATASADDATCESLAGPATIAKLTANNYVPFDANEANTTADPGFMRVDDYGGLLCEYAIPHSDGYAYWGYGPITAEQAEFEKQQLRDLVAADHTLTLETGTNKHGGWYAILGGANGPSHVVEVYVISPRGYWAFSLSETTPDIQDVVANAPVFY
jgi:hypothetical protein